MYVQRVTTNGAFQVFPVGETHGIPKLAENRLVADSAELGWRNLYASLALERCWSATLRKLPHCALAYCLNGSATIIRRIEDERAETLGLGPRQFGIIPAGGSLYAF
jgi:hypothetical protein